MLATAIALQEATQEAVHDEETMAMASALFHHRNEITEDEFIRMIYIYSAHLASLTATLVTNVCLTESQLNEMMDTIKEMNAIGEEITNGND
jgi:hypothetical protein